MKTKYKCFIYKGGNKMRQSYNGAILINSIDKNKGINLGADFCAEHEWGILRLSDYLGVNSSLSNFGIGRKKLLVENLLKAVQLKLKAEIVF